MEGILENVFAAHSDWQRLVHAPERRLVKALPEIVDLVVKVEHCWIVDENRERTTHERWRVFHKRIQQLAMLLGERGEA